MCRKRQHGRAVPSIVERLTSTSSPAHRSSFSPKVRRKRAASISRASRSSSSDFSNVALNAALRTPCSNWRISTERRPAAGARAEAASRWESSDICIAKVECSISMTTPTTTSEPSASLPLGRTTRPATFGFERTRRRSTQSSDNGAAMMEFHRKAKINSAKAN